VREDERKENIQNEKDKIDDTVSGKWRLNHYYERPYPYNDIDDSAENLKNEC
jgi:hypothetical protein